MKCIGHAIVIATIGLLAAGCGHGSDTGQTVQAGADGSTESSGPAEAALNEASEDTISGSGNARQFRNVLLGSEIGRFPPSPSDAAELMPLSDAVVQGTVVAASLQPTPEGASGATADDDAAELWLTLELEVKEALGDEIKPGDRITWAFVAWIGDPQYADEEGKRLSAAVEASYGLDATVFLHRSAAVDGWWSHASGAGAIVRDGSVAATLDQSIAIGSESYWDTPQVWSDAESSLSALGTRPTSPALGD